MNSFLPPLSLLTSSTHVSLLHLLLKPNSQYDAGPSITLHRERHFFLPSGASVNKCGMWQSWAKSSISIGPMQRKQCWNRTQVYLSITWCYSTMLDPASYCEPGFTITHVSPSLLYPLFTVHVYHTCIDWSSCCSGHCTDRKERSCWQGQETWLGGSSCYTAW